MNDSELFGFFDEFEDTAYLSEEHVDKELIFETDPQLPVSLDDHRDKDVALYRLDILKFIEKRLEGGWTPTHLTPLLEKYAVSKKAEVPSARTVANWKKAYLESGKDPKSLLPKHDKKGVARRSDDRVRRDTEHIVQEAIEEKYLIKERPSINTAYEYYRYRVLEENKSKTLNLKPISQRTFYNRVNSLPPYDVALARFGKRYADNKYKSFGTQIPATRPMEFVEIDHTTAPIILIDDELELPIGRPHLTILYDRYSSCIVGLSVNYRDPSYETVRAALLSALLKKDWIRDKYPSIESDWPCHGKITNLVVDNGAEFWSDSLESGLKPLVTNILYNQRGKPWHKPGVEKSFDTFYKKLFSRFPGKTFTNTVELKDYDPKRDAVMKVSVFMELLYKWLIDVYHQKPDSRNTRVPIVKWREKADMLVSYEGDEEQLVRIELGIVNQRAIIRGAIKLHSLRYQSPELEDYGKRNPPTVANKLIAKTKTDPSDISYIYVYLDNEKKYIKVPAVDPDGYTQNRSLYEHQRINAVRRLKVRLDQNEESLAEASLYIDRMVDEAIENMAKSKQGKTLPKTTHASRIAKQKGIGSEGPTSLINHKSNNRGKDAPVTPASNKEVEGNYLDLSNIEGY